MATKNNPGNFDCYDKAEPDEPMFVLLARDRHAVALVWLWATLRKLDKEDEAVTAEALACAKSMVDWAVEHGRKPVGIGCSVLAGVLGLIRSSNDNAEKFANSATGDDEVRRILAVIDAIDSKGGG